MERMRERALSIENQMFGDSRKQRQWYRVKDNTGKILEESNSVKSYVERDGEIITTHPIKVDYLFGAFETNQHGVSRTYSLRNVSVEGDVRISGQK